MMSGEKIKGGLRANFPLILVVSVILLILMNISVVTRHIRQFINIIHPLVLGLIIAYILNILMVKFEKIYFPNSKNKWVQSSRRVVCILLSIISIVGIFYVISLLIIPQLINAIKVLGGNFPKYYNRATNWIYETSKDSLLLKDAIKGINFQDGKEVIQNILRFLGSWTGNLVGVVSGFFSTIFNFIIALIFAIYILTSKEKLRDQSKRMMKAYLKQEKIDHLLRVLTLSNQVFTNYVIGQCMEAIILGVLCAVGMIIFRFPYATMVGSVIGITALIPMVGAYLGAGIGAFMVLTVSPIQMIFFFVFIIILQQLENNLIYPKVVGSSVGLPGIWVLVAVTIGGGLFGVTGILFSVPVGAVIYQLLNYDIEKRNQMISKSN